VKSGVDISSDIRATGPYHTYALQTEGVFRMKIEDELYLENSVTRYVQGSPSDAFDLPERIYLHIAH
jgi:hypothetical protein